MRYKRLEEHVVRQQLAYKKILLLMEEDPKISRKAISEKLDINTSAIQKHAEIIKREDGDFGGEWIVLKKEELN